MLLKDVKKILLIQLGDIGDLVWMTPTLWAVKEACPQAELSLLVREENGALLEADPAVGRILAVRQYRGSLYERLRKQLLFLRDFRRENFDLVIDLRADERGAVMARLSGAPLRVAQHYQGGPFWRNSCFNRLVHPSYRENTGPGAAEQTLRIVRELGMEVRTTIPRLWIGKETAQSVRRIIGEEKIAELPRWCSLNPFSRWSYKELPEDKWVAIVDWLWQEFRMATVLVGAKKEREKAARLAWACSGRVWNLAGQTTLAELAGLLKLSQLHIGVDSAAPHIAAAVGTPTVTIYGPSDWRDWALTGERHRLVVAEGDCVPCHQKGCQNGNVSQCLETLPVEKIKEALRDILEGLEKSPI